MTAPTRTTRIGITLALLGLAGLASASSHREAPAIVHRPSADATDFYMFRSYEPGREDNIVFVANYLPLQDPYGGPNYFSLDDDVVYRINIDNNADVKEDIVYEFRFKNKLNNIGIPVGPPGQEKMVSVPLLNIGPIVDKDSPTQIQTTFTLTEKRGKKKPKNVLDNATASKTFRKPLDNIGDKTFSNYDSYANQFIYDIDLPGGVAGRMFVGQRKDPFVVNLGETFDLFNFDPLGPPNGEDDDLVDKNITSMILEVPISALIRNGQPPVIGGWTTAHLPRTRTLTSKPKFGKVDKDKGALVQVSRLGSPLVNELIIGVGDKDRFNGSKPKDDSQFLDYVTNPTLPTFVEALFGGVQAPTLFPRDDLVAAFLTGIDGFTSFSSNPARGEMLRLNTAVSPTPAGSQSRLGVLDGDFAGFPNGRRPGDDVVDITLRVAMGALLTPLDAPSGQLPFTDGAIINATFLDAEFPYLLTPLPGSPQSP